MGVRHGKAVNAGVSLIAGTGEEAKSEEWKCSPTSSGMLAMVVVGEKEVAQTVDEGCSWFRKSVARQNSRVTKFVTSKQSCSRGNTLIRRSH